MKVVGLAKDSRKTRSSKSALRNLPPMLQFYRSWDKDTEDNRMYREYVPVWWDAANNEVWDAKIDPATRECDQDHEAWTISAWPRGVLDYPFELHDGQIPQKVWDVLKQSKVSLRLVGGSHAGKTVRGKKHPVVKGKAAVEP